MRRMVKYLMLVEFSLSSGFRRDNIACTSYRCMNSWTKLALVCGGYKFLRQIATLHAPSNLANRSTAFLNSFHSENQCWAVAEGSRKYLKNDICRICTLTQTHRWRFVSEHTHNLFLTTIISQTFHVMQRTLAVSFCINPNI